MDFHGKKQMIIPISENFFAEETTTEMAFNQTQKVHIVIEKSLNGTEVGTISIDQIEVVYLKH